MKGVRRLFVNTIIMTGTSLIIRVAGVSFQVYLSNRIGPEGIGLYQLILSVYILAITLSVSGVRLAATRLVAEEMGRDHANGAKRALKICFLYAIFFGSVAAAALYFGSEYIGTKWLSDARTVKSLRLFAVTLPLISVSSVTSGYFTAVRRIVKSSMSQLTEQLVGIAVTVAIFTYVLSPDDIESACVAVVIGSLVGELSSFTLQSILFFGDLRRHLRRPSDSEIADGIPGRVFRIAFPVAVGAYIASGMRTIQQILIPVGFKKYGASSESALATYGTISGMVMPIIMFPSVVYSTVAELIVPELAECVARGNKQRVQRIITRLLGYGLVSSFGLMSIALFYSNEISLAVYKNTSTASFMKLLSPIIPLMYLDILVDGILKGIGEQTRTMFINSLESFVSLVLVYFLLPIYAAWGYIFVLLFARALNFLLSLGHLIRVTGFRPKMRSIFGAILGILGAYNVTSLITYFTGIPVVVQLASYVVVYALLLKTVNSNDICRDL